TVAPPFYSAAPVPREKYTLWLFATVDGQVHLLDGITDQSAGKLSWGSDIAAVRSSCGSGWQILATRSGSGSNDSIRAYAFHDRGILQPAIATSWEPEPGNQRWHFYLRPGISFHDGTAVSADAVAASLRTANPNWKVFPTGDSVVIECASPDPWLPAELALARN